MVDNKFNLREQAMTEADCCLDGRLKGEPEVKGIVTRAATSEKATAAFILKMKTQGLLEEFSETVWNVMEGVKLKDERSWDVQRWMGDLGWRATRVETDMNVRVRRSWRKAVLSTICGMELL
jgi:hypothetical protein